MGYAAVMSCEKKEKIKESPECPICCKEQETIEQLLFCCEWTRGIWFAVCAGLRIERESLSRFDVWLLKIVEKLGREKEKRRFC